MSQTRRRRTHLAVVQSCSPAVVHIGPYFLGEAQYTGPDRCDGTQDDCICFQQRVGRQGLVGSFLLLSAFKPALQSIAFVGGLFSVVSFLILAAAAGSHNAQIARVVVADLVVLICLVVGALAHVHMLRKRW
ncbi:hypothetical protein [Massilia sp. TWP1-3-3]|uniref:hypothetical protein n=1 Tax=Massilia sp. TWP1-3-3 TaxID=2804573 RepID=UPI003CEF7290